MKKRVGEIAPGDVIHFEQHTGLVSSYEDNLGEYPAGVQTVVSVEVLREQTYSGRRGGGHRYVRLTFGNGRSINVSSSSKFPVSA